MGPIPLGQNVIEALQQHANIQGTPRAPRSASKLTPRIDLDGSRSARSASQVSFTTSAKNRPWHSNFSAETGRRVAGPGVDKSPRSMSAKNKWAALHKITKRTPSHGRF